jgi:hypothetical protein
MYACWLNFEEKFFSAHAKPSKLLEKPKNLDQIPGNFGLTTLGWKNLVSKWCSIISIKAYASWLNFVEKFFTTHVNPRKLLEKSGTKSEGILDLRHDQQI